MKIEIESKGNAEKFESNDGDVWIVTYCGEKEVLVDWKDKLRRLQQLTEFDGNLGSCGYFDRYELNDNALTNVRKAKLVAVEIQ